MRTCLLLLLWTPAMACAGQTLVGNGATITMVAGAQLSVKGDVLLSAGGIDNAGTIDLSGDWTNNSGTGCFGDSEGSVELNGAGQSIAGTSPTQFHHLDLMGGDVALQQHAYVGGSMATARSGVLALGASRLFLNGQVLSTSNSGPGAVTRSTGMLVSETAPPADQGRFNWVIGTHAPATYEVPFGDGADLLPVHLGIVSSSSDALFAISFATYPTDPFAAPNNRPLPSGMPVLTDMLGAENAPNVVDRFWLISTGETSDAPTATLAFTYRELEWNAGTNTISEPLLMAQRWDGAQWSLPPMGVVNTVQNMVATPPIDHFDLVWALAQGSTPLPVELLTFTGERVSAREVDLAWSTATEHDNAGFEVWRMIEGEADFTEVGWVAGAGDAQQRTDYAFIDANDAERTSYYKLKQVDIDGQHTWTPVIAVAGTGTPEQLIAFPNPASDQLHVSGLPAGARIALFDAAGRMVRGWSQLPRLDALGDLQRGCYAVVAERSNGERSSVRVVLQ